MNKTKNAGQTPKQHKVGMKFLYNIIPIIIIYAWNLHHEFKILHVHQWHDIPPVPLVGYM